MFKENIINLTCGTIIKMRTFRMYIFIQCRMESNVGLPSLIDKDMVEQSHTTLYSICKE